MTLACEAANLIGVAEPIVAAVDNGGTNTRILLMQGDTPLAPMIQYPTPRDYSTAVDRIGTVSHDLAGGRRIDAVGFAVAGAVQNGTIASAGQLQEYGWCGQPFAENVAERMAVELGAIVLLNDCGAAAKSQQVENRRRGGPNIGYIETISTGWGGAGFNVEDNALLPDEPGHVFLREGAICGCGTEGCAEAHISGSGIERKFGIRGEDLTVDIWKTVIQDTVAAHAQMLERFEEQGFRPSTLYFFGSVALKSPYVLPGLRSGLQEIAESTHRIPFLPFIEVATNGDDSGIKGAKYAAQEVLTV